MEWVLALWFAFCMANDERVAMATPKPMPLPTPPFDELAWRKANGLPTTEAEVNAGYEQYLAYKKEK